MIHIYNVYKVFFNPGLVLGFVNVFYYKIKRLRFIRIKAFINSARH